MSWRRLQNVLKTSWGRHEEVLKTSLQDVLKTSWRCLGKASWRRLEDIWPRWIYWSWIRRLEDVFWRRKAKANLFLLIKTSWRQRRLDHDEYLLGRTFLVGSRWFVVPFPKLQTFSGIFWVVSVDCSQYEKTVLGIFVYLFIFEVTSTKVRLRFHKQCSQTTTPLICKQAIFAHNASIDFQL